MSFSKPTILPVVGSLNEVGGKSAEVPAMSGGPEVELGDEVAAPFAEGVDELQAATPKATATDVATIETHRDLRPRPLTEPR